jgi:two-component system, NtrC family, nitrogen regulation response regulator NtrX
MSLDVLIVDDEQDIRDLISDILSDDGYKTRVASNSTAALESIKERVPAVVVLDIWLQGSEMDGLGVLEIVKKRYPNLPVIMISGHGNIETAINSIRLGAYDYIEKPFKEDRILRLVKRAVETAKLKHENEELKKTVFENHLIGESAAIVTLRQLIDKVAPTESRIMINGAAGSGKEVVARLIHQKSRRANNPFVILNASSISPDKVEEELFGREDSHAHSGDGKTGTLERAHGGTLFLDEVADMPLNTQGKILRILQEGSLERLGSNKRVAIDVRIIASTNKNLQAEIAAGRFREDLYYRLNVVPIKVPSLKERTSDIAIIADYFMEKCAESIGVPPKQLSESAIAAMEVYSWPGNIRQLRNVIEWLLIMATDDAGNQITSSMLPPEVLSSNPMVGCFGGSADIMGLPLRDAREIFETEYLTAQLERFGGNVSKTATFIGMERSAFHRKLKSLGVKNKELQDVPEEEYVLA